MYQLRAKEQYNVSDNFTLYKYRKYHRFQVCDICNELEEEIQVVTDPRHSRQLRQKRQGQITGTTHEGNMEMFYVLSFVLPAHLHFVRQERRAYGVRIARALKFQEMFLSLTIDGSDQSLYGLPWFK